MSVSDFALFGRLHPLLLHVPIGLLLGALVLEVLATRKTLARTALGPFLWLAAASAALSAAAGWVLSHEEGYDGETLEWHERLGIALSIAAVLAAVLHDPRGASRARLGLYRAALVAFSHIVSASQGLTEDLDRIRESLFQNRGEGATALIDAAHVGMLIGESDVGRSLLIVFSDGVDTSSWLNADAVLETARRGDVVVYGVEIGERRASFPRDLTEVTGGRLFSVESTKDLSSVFGKILEEFRNRYLISYSPQGVTTDGWHRLEVRVRTRGATVKARPGYFRGQG